MRRASAYWQTHELEHRWTLGRNAFELGCTCGRNRWRAENGDALKRRRFFILDSKRRIKKILSVAHVLTWHHLDFRSVHGVRFAH